MIPKMKILKKNKWKKCLEILSFYRYMCTINVHHMISGSWNIRCDREIFVILGHFLPFQPPDKLENQNFKVEKKHLEILSFKTFAPKMTIFWRMVPEISNVTDNFLSFWTIFCPFTPPNNPKNQNFEKIKKKQVEILSFYTSVP